MFTKLLLRTSRRPLITLALLIVVSMVCSVLMYMLQTITQREIQAQIAPTVWGDITISWAQALGTWEMAQIEQIVAEVWGQISQTISMNYTLVTQDNIPLLTSVLWVDELYPLYGDFDLDSIGVDVWSDGSDESDGSDIWSDVQIQTGMLRLDTSLADALDIDISPVSALQTPPLIDLNATSLPVAWLIREMPGSGGMGSFFSEWRTLIAHKETLENVWLLSQWSRVSHTTAIKLPQDDIDSVLPAIRAQIEQIPWLAQSRISDISQSQWLFQSLLGSLRGYTSLIILLLLVLQATSIVFLGIRIVTDHNQPLQLLRVYGLTTWSIITKILMWTIRVILIWVWVSGVLLALVSWWLSSSEIVSWESVETTASLLSSRRVIFANVLIVIWAGSIPVKKLISNSPLASMHTTLNPGLWLSRWWIVGGVSLLYIVYRLLVWDVMTSLVSISVLIAWVLVLMWLVWLIHTLIYRWATSAWWRESRFARWDISRFLHKPGTYSLFVTWASSLMVVMLTRSVMSYLWLQAQFASLTQWGETLFVTNVFADDLEKIDQLSVPVSEIYPVILWRIVSLNTTPRRTHLLDQWIPPREQWGFTREFNMTDALLEDVPLVEGVTLPETWGVSVDADFAARAWVQVWDQIQLSVAGRQFDLQVANLRSSQRTGIRPFFYFQVSPTQFTNAPKTTFFDVQVDPSQEWAKTSIKSEIVSLMWNNVSFIDTGEIIEQVRWYVDRISGVMLALFGLVIWYALIALVSLFSYAQVFQERRQEVYALMGADDELLWSLSRGYRRIYGLIAGAIGIVSVGLFARLFSAWDVFVVTPFVWMMGVVVSAVIVVVLVGVFERGS